MTPELKEKVRLYIGYLIEEDYLTNRYNEDRHMVYSVATKTSRNQSDVEAIVESGIIGVSWETGGARGGNCYGSEAEPYTVESPEIKDIVLLDTIIEQLTPDISYMQYKAILRQAPIHEKSTGSYEYYGNRTDYIVRYHKADELVAAFENANLKFNEEFIDTMLQSFESKKQGKKKLKY